MHRATARRAAQWARVGVRRAVGRIRDRFGEWISAYGGMTDAVPSLNCRHSRASGNPPVAIMAMEVKRTGTRAKKVALSRPIRTRMRWAGSRPVPLRRTSDATLRLRRNCARGRRCRSSGPARCRMDRQGSMCTPMRRWERSERQTAANSAAASGPLSRARTKPWIMLRAQCSSASTPASSRRRT